MNLESYIAAFLFMDVSKDMFSNRNDSSAQTIKSASDHLLEFIGETDSELTSKFVALSLDSLADLEVVEAIKTKHAAARYLFSADRYHRTLQNGSGSESIDTVLRYVEKLGMPWLHESIRGAFDELQGTPRGTMEDPADRDWEPLPIDLSNSADAELIAALEQAADSIESDNGYAANEPLERNDVVIRLRGGIQFLKTTPALTYSALQAYVLWPLERVTARFDANTALGGAASFAWSVVVSWLKARGIKALDDLTSGLK